MQICLAGEKNTNLPRTQLALTHPTPLYQHRLANADEYKMSEVSRKIESTGEACLNPPRSMPKLASPYFWWPFTDSFCVAMAEPLVPYVRVTVPTAPREMNVLFKSIGCACFVCCIRPLFEYPLVPPPLPPLHHRHEMKEDLSNCQTE